MSTAPFVTVVLAAGMGTRMKSALPKVLHPIAGVPLVGWPVRAALEAGASRVVVVTGTGREQVEVALRERFGARVDFAFQAEQRGTGDAVRCALPALDGFEGRIVVLNGDCPLIEPSTIERLVVEANRTDAAMALVTTTIDSPRGYGRILRDERGVVRAIREEKDASDEERAIREVNPGVYAIASAFLRRTIATLDTNNAAGELYLTDLVGRAFDGDSIADVAGELDELRGVNDRFELATCAAARRARIAERLARDGVTLDDPATTYVDADVVVEPDASLGAGVHLRGRTIVRAGARIDVGAVLTDVEVRGGVHVHPYCVASGSSLGEGAEVGPFSHLRTKTTLGPKSKVGNFTETKNTTLGEGSKVNHLAYVGDGQIGSHVNVGAGTIFCNYDGFVKNTTILEDEVFIGSDSQLVAPVRVGRGAYVASGTTVTKDVPENALAIARVKQENKEGLAEKLRARGRAAKAARSAKP